MRSARVWLVVAWVTVGGLLTFWLASTSNVDLRDELRHWQFWSLEAQFWLLAGASAVAGPELIRSLGLHARAYLAPAMASAAAVLLVLGVAPRTNRIYYDEQIYQHVGQNLADLRLAQMCNDGSTEYGSLQCNRAEYNKEPYGYPFLLSVGYRAFGAREGVAAAVNVLAAVAAVWIAFLLTFALSESIRAASLAAVVMALVPEFLRWSHTAAAEPVAAAGCGLAVLAAAAFVRTRSTAALIWTAASGVFAMQIRAEGALAALLGAGIILWSAPSEIRRTRSWWTGLLAVALAAVPIAHLVAVRGENWGALAGPRFSSAFVMHNLGTNGGFLLGDARFPWVYTALAVAGVVASPLRRARVVALAYFALFWGVFLFFYAGSYDYGADDRFSLLIAIPLAMLAGLGAAAAIDAARRGRTWAAGSVMAVAVAVLVAQFSWYLPFVRAIGEEAWGARADVAFARAAVARLPRNAVVLTHNPGMFLFWGQSAAQASIAAGEPDYIRGPMAARYAGGVYFHWNYWCNVSDPVQQAFCRGVLDRFPHTLVSESTERDYRYAIYRLNTTTEPPPAGR